MPKLPFLSVVTLTIAALLASSQAFLLPAQTRAAFAPTVAGALRVIVVHTAEPQAAVVVSPALVKTSSTCSVASTQVSNFLQDSGGINLNEPASCFTLVQAREAMQPNLVVTFAQPVAIVVPPAAGTFLQQSWLKRIALQKDSVLPLLGLVLFYAFILEEKKTWTKFLRPRNIFGHCFNLFELCIMRC